MELNLNQFHLSTKEFPPVKQKKFSIINSLEYDLVEESQAPALTRHAAVARSRRILL